MLPFLICGQSLLKTRNTYSTEYGPCNQIPWRNRAYNHTADDALNKTFIQLIAKVTTLYNCLNSNMGVSLETVNVEPRKGVPHWGSPQMAQVPRPTAVTQVLIRVQTFTKPRQLSHRWKSGPHTSVGTWAIAKPAALATSQGAPHYHR